MRMQKLSPMGLAIENIRRRYFRTICLAGVVALLSFVLIGGSLLAASLMNGARSVSARLGADALLVPAGYEQDAEGALLRGEPSAFFFDGALAERLLAAEDIEVASPQLFIASFDSSHCSEAVQMIGYDPKTDFVIAPWLLNALPDGLPDGEIVVGSDIVGEPGGMLRFFDRVYKVAGKLEKTGMGFDTSVFLNMDSARLALKDYVALGGKNVPDSPGAISSIAVKIKPDIRPSDFKLHIQNGFRKDGVDVVLTQAMFGNISDSLNVFLRIVVLLIALVWLMSVGVLAILFTVTLNERKREFGVYRVLGATRRKLVHIILYESAIVSLLGALFGAALVSLIYFSFSSLIGISIKIPYLQPSGETIALLLGGGLLVSFVTGPLASLYAATQIGRLATYAIMKEGE